jgi:hypothetical protein
MITDCDTYGGTVEVLAGVCEVAGAGCDSRGDCPYNKTGPEAEKAFRAEAERVYGPVY